jgi:hypothetical protein
MKKVSQLPLFLGAVLLLGACSTISSRIEEKAPLFYSLDETTRAKISHGDIDVGYTPDMVYIALGHPDLKRESVSAQGRTEQWIYRSYYEDYVGPRYVGFHRWHSYHPYGRFHRVYWAPVYTDVYRHSAQDDIRITFREGKVVLIDQVKT